MHGLSVRKDLQGTWMQGKDICEGERPHKEENGLPGSDDHICEYGIPQDGDQRRYRSQAEWGSGGADPFEQLRRARKCSAGCQGKTGEFQ